MWSKVPVFAWLPLSFLQNLNLRYLKLCIPNQDTQVKVGENWSGVNGVKGHSGLGNVTVRDRGEADADCPPVVLRASGPRRVRVPVPGHVCLLVEWLIKGKRGLVELPAGFVCAHAPWAACPGAA